MLRRQTNESVREPVSVIRAKELHLAFPSKTGKTSS
jgi:hypothetical protein